MRLPLSQVEFIREYWNQKDSSLEVFLFGSRVDDSLKGGDIDILLLGNHKIHHAEIFKMKESFYKLFGQQKLDVLSFTFNDESKFLKHILKNAKKI